MRVTRTSRLQIRAQTVSFVMLFLGIIGLLAWLSTKYSFQADWTASKRNTVSDATVELLKVMDGPVTVTAYATEDEGLRRGITDLVGRYQRFKSDLQLKFVNPEQEPQLVRQLNITQNGEMVVEYAGRSGHVRDFNEQGFTNTLQQLTRSGERWVVFLEGHGERAANGVANHDLSAFTRQLTGKGIKLQSINLVNTPSIPQNTSVLVIAGPQVDYLPGEIKLIREWIDKGGNVLWLLDPGPMRGLGPIAEHLGVALQPGIVVDPTTQLLGINDPRFAIVAEYPPHAVTRGFKLVTLLPQAASLEFKVPEGWQGEALLQTVDRSWSETGPMNSDIALDKGKDIPGPLTVGVALSRDAPEAANADEKKQQRILVIGDGDFLSNAFLGNGGNLDLGMSMVNWLTHDDDLVAIPTRTAADRNLELSPAMQIVIGFGFLLLIPALLVGSGVVIWWKRRKQ